MQSVSEINKYLPFRVVKAVSFLPKEITENINEIRLRLNLPVSVTVGSRNIYISESGKPNDMKNPITVTEKEISECLCLISDYSMYSFGDDIKNGFITLENGSRVGVCGEGVTENGKIVSVKNITSVSFRISRFYENFAKPLYDALTKEKLQSVMVYSPPGRGKTTFLKSCAYLFSSGKKPYRVGLADERGELFDEKMKPCLIDRVKGMPKKKAIEILTRSMSPQIIICDEISDTEGDEIIESQNTGVCFFASCHADSVSGMMKRPYIKKMAEHGVFSLCVGINENYGLDICRELF